MLIESEAAATSASFLPAQFSPFSFFLRSTQPPPFLSLTPLLLHRRQRKKKEKRKKEKKHTKSPAEGKIERKVLDTVGSFQCTVDDTQDRAETGECLCVWMEREMERERKGG